MTQQLTAAAIDSNQNRKMTGPALTIYNSAVGLGVSNDVAAIMVGQAMHETGNFTSPFFTKGNNCFGYSYVKGGLYQLDKGGPNADNGVPIAQYASINDSVKEIVAWWGRRMKENKFAWPDISTPAQYVERLKRYGYFEDKQTNYLNGVTAWLGKIGTFGKELMSDPVKAAKENPMLCIMVATVLFLLLNVFGGGKRNA
jgi:hypothetical protein